MMIVAMITRPTSIPTPTPKLIDRDLQLHVVTALRSRRCHPLRPGVPVDDLATRLTERLISVGRDDVVIPLSPADACKERDALSKGLYQRLFSHLVAGLNERLRVYRYGAGQYFRKHRDGCFQRSLEERSFLTLMLYLNDDFVGGETVFEGAVVRPRTGSALWFFHPLLHEGREVRAGQKYALRTDVMYRR